MSGRGSPFPPLEFAFHETIVTFEKTNDKIHFQTSANQDDGVALNLFWDGKVWEHTSASYISLILYVRFSHVYTLIQ